MHSGPLVIFPSQSVILNCSSEWESSQRTRALNPYSFWEEVLSPCPRPEVDTKAPYFWVICFKKYRTVSRKETSPTEVSSGAGTRHSHQVTMFYFSVAACFIKILFPLQKTSAIIHSAFPCFASCYFPRQTDSIPHLKQMAASGLGGGSLKQSSFRGDYFSHHFYLHMGEAVYHYCDSAYTWFWLCLCFQKKRHSLLSVLCWPVLQEILVPPWNIGDLMFTLSCKEACQEWLLGAVLTCMAMHFFKHIL